MSTNLDEAAEAEPVTLRDMVRAARKHGLRNITYFEALLVLAEEGPQSSSAISQMLGFSSAAATGLVDKLASQGFVESHRTAEDRRAVVISITPQGRVAYDAIFAGQGPKVRACRVCGCTDNDCSQCVAKTGEACHWVEDDLCSACK